MSSCLPSSYASRQRTMDYFPSQRCYSDLIEAVWDPAAPRLVNSSCVSNGDWFLLVNTLLCVFAKTFFVCFLKYVFPHFSERCLYDLVSPSRKTLALGIPAQRAPPHTWPQVYRSFSWSTLIIHFLRNGCGACAFNQAGTPHVGFGGLLLSGGAIREWFWNNGSPLQLRDGEY